MISREDARMIFSDCLVRYNSTLVYVMDIVADGILCFDLERQEVTNIRTDYSDIKPISSRLGYLDFGSISVFICRNPVRRYKVGINKHNLSIQWGDYPYTEAEQRFVSEAIDSMSGKAFVNTFNNRYPTLKEALDRIRKGHKIVAFERQFAISKKLDVFYKGDAVGKYQPDIESFVMDKGKEHLLSIITNRG